MVTAECFCSAKLEERVQMEILPQASEWKLKYRYSHREIAATG